MRFVEMEWLLPIEAAATAVRTVRELVRCHRHTAEPLSPTRTREADVRVMTVADR